MAKEFLLATDEVGPIARGAIDDWHPHLGPIRIEYVFVLDAPRKNGKVLWAQAKKIGGLNAWLAQEKLGEQPEPAEFFVIEVVKQIWDQLDEKSRLALLDHELSHCWVDDNGKLSIQAHDLEEFNAVVRRHGLWRDDVQLFFEAGADHRQERLAFERGIRALPARVMRSVADEINRGALDREGVTATATVRSTD